MILPKRPKQASLNKAQSPFGRLRAGSLRTPHLYMPEVRSGDGFTYREARPQCRHASRGSEADVIAAGRVEEPAEAGSPLIKPDVRISRIRLSIRK